MAFLKAVQHTSSEAYKRYVVALLVYKEERKKYEGIRRRFAHSVSPLEQLAFYKAKEQHSTACKEFYAAREEYKKAQIAEKLQEKGIDLLYITPQDIAKIAQVSVPASESALVHEARKEALVKEMGVEELARIALVVKEAQRKRNTPEIEFDTPEVSESKDMDTENSYSSEAIDLDAMGDKPAAME